jgi:RNA polymerase sigma-70 factor (sigma-E family)
MVGAAARWQGGAVDGEPGAGPAAWPALAPAVAPGADDGFDGFVTARWAPLVATAYLVTGDRGVAEDCVQEALVRVHRRWGRIDPAGRGAYAHRAAVNAALSWRRRRRIAEVAYDAARHDVGHPHDDPVGVDPRLLAALRTLAPRARAAVVLRFLEDRSEAQTAEILGCSVGTVKSLTSRGVARLREVLEVADEDGATAIDVTTDHGVRGGRRA